MANTKPYNVTLVERWRYLNDQNNPTDGYRITFKITETNSVDHIICSVVEFDNKDVLREKILQSVQSAIDTYNL